MSSITTDSVTAILPKVCAIAAQAATAIMEVYQRADFGAQQKIDDSPVTAADLAAHHIITTGLAALTPDIPMISEEQIQLDYATRQTWTNYWLIDPLDGTKEFIARNDQFCICIALMSGDVPILGVVFAPVTQMLWYGIHQKGSFSAKWQNNWCEIRFTKLNCAIFALRNKHLRVPVSRSHVSPQLNDFLAQTLNTPQLIPCGSALKMMLLAEGKADYYPRIGTTMEWDTAAAQVILTEAGGTFQQLQNQQPMKYNKADLRNPDFLAHGILLHHKG
jgi:3'(2'), 5'-bisphosphate nucleotidase